MQTTKKCPARGISKLDSQDHKRKKKKKARHSTHADASPMKLEEILMQNSILNNNKTKNTLKNLSFLVFFFPQHEKGIMEI